MKGKRGSTSEWFLVFLIAVVVGGLVLFISSNIFYKKSEVYTKEEVNNSLDKISCEYLLFEDTSYFGQTPRAICESMGKEPELLFIREVVHVLSSEGFNTYDDENYLVDNTLFDVPLGLAEDLERSYGNPSFGYGGDVNRISKGLLCCG